MKLDEIRQRLVMSLTAFDRQQSGKRSYNPYALGQYLQRIDEVMRDIENLTQPREALVRAFAGSLLNRCLKAIGESPYVPGETGSGALHYHPGYKDRQDRQTL